MSRSSAPPGPYQIAATGESARVFVLQTPYTLECRAAWVPDDPAHHPLNDVLAHVSVMELDRLAKAAADGAPFVLDQLDDILPRPGWEIVTRIAQDPSRFTFRELDTDVVHGGSRRELLLLLELTARASLSAYSEPSSQLEWVVRLRAVYPHLAAALDGNERFEWANKIQDNR